MTAWQFLSTVLDVHDGDTVKLDVALGRSQGKDRDFGFRFRIQTHRFMFRAQCRLLGINAPELATPEGVAARDYLVSIMPVGTVVVAETRKPEAGTEDDKYGRWLARIVLSDGTDVSAAMISSGHAAPWDGKGPKPVP